MTETLAYSGQWFHLGHWSPTFFLYRIARDEVFENTRIYFRVDDHVIEARSILDLVMLACYCGYEVEIVAEGGMAMAAVDYFSKLFGCATEDEMMACAGSFDLLHDRSYLR